MLSKTTSRPQRNSDIRNVTIKTMDVRLMVFLVGQVTLRISARLTEISGQGRFSCFSVSALVTLVILLRDGRHRFCVRAVFVRMDCP